MLTFLQYPIVLIGFTNCGGIGQSATLNATVFLILCLNLHTQYRVIGISLIFLNQDKAEIHRIMLPTKKKKKN